MNEQRVIQIRHAHTTHKRTDESGVEHEITDPLRKRPKTMTRREWRELVRKGYRVTRKQQLEERRAEAQIPEAEKIDRRLHAAGLYSHRDMGRIRPVEFRIEGA